MAIRARQWLLGAVLILLAANAAAQPCSPTELLYDVRNCGTCGNDCTVGSVASNFECRNGSCFNIGCRSGFYDLDNNGTCEYACNFVSAQESCNGNDDDCDGQIDESPVAPTPVQVCGVSPSATRAECTSQVQLACVSGAWQCTFQAGVCPGGNCASATEICDNLDNNCDGRLNENVPTFGQSCASDEGQAPPGHGLCRTTGTRVCSGPNSVTCNAVQANCSTLPGGCTEFCDGIDNDCDQLVDEPFNNRGSNPAFFVQPAVARVSSAPNVWMYRYEASRPNATSIVSGVGNGYHTSAPPGVTLDRTTACSVPNKMAWIQVTPREVEQTCAAMGGSVCSTAQFQTACRPDAACLYGYSPRGGTGSACATGYNAGKYCNLQPSYDSNAALPGDQDGLLPGGSASLLNCSADWSGTPGNVAGQDRLFDLTGNTREITRQAAGEFVLMGASMLHRVELGATCGSTFYVVDQAYGYYDTSFRCCFSSDPTL